MSNHGTLQWARGPARVVGGGRYVTRRGQEPYVLDNPRDALLDLASVPKPISVERFVSAWGLLHSGREQPDAIPEAISMVEAVADDLSRTLSARIALRDGDEETLQKLLPVLARRVEEVREEWPMLPDDPVDGVGDAIQHLLSAFLQDRPQSLPEVEGQVQPQGVQPFLRHKGGGAFALEVGPDLYASIYYALADVLANPSVNISRCPQCLRYFEPKDARQVYCQTACSNRARYETRKRKRQQERKGNESNG